MAGEQWRNNLTALYDGLARDKAITTDQRGWPTLPNKGWAAQYMRHGWYHDMARDMFIMQDTHPTDDIDPEDYKDLRIIANEAGYKVVLKDCDIIFVNQYSTDY